MDRLKMSSKKDPPQTAENERRNSSSPLRKNNINNKAVQKPLFASANAGALNRRWTDPHPKAKVGEETTTFGESSKTQNMSTKKAKKDSRRFQIEPIEITFNIAINKPVNLAERMKIMNFSCNSIYFTSRSTGSDLRPEPAAGIIKPFDTIEISIVQTSTRLFKSTAEKKSRNRVTFEWIPLSAQVGSNINKAIALRSKTLPENRFRHSFYVNYIIQQKNEVSSEMVECCRSAFFLPELIILSGDFEIGDVSTTFDVTNETDYKVIWHFGEIHNILLSTHPNNGIINPKESQTITLTAKQFHVGNISKISDRLVMEWTAAINELDQYSDMALEDAPKIFKYVIKVAYRVIGRQRDGTGPTPRQGPIPPHRHHTHPSTTGHKLISFFQCYTQLIDTI